MIYWTSCLWYTRPLVCIIFGPLHIVYRITCLWYIKLSAYSISDPYQWYIGPHAYGTSILTPLHTHVWYIKPTTYGILTPCTCYTSIGPNAYDILTIYLWYIEPCLWCTNGILNPLCMKYGTSFPWYCYPSTLGISNTQYLWSLTIYQWYIESSAYAMRMVCWTHYLWHVNLPVHEIWNTLPIVFWPPTHDISNRLSMVYRTSYICNIKLPAYGILTS